MSRLIDADYIMSALGIFTDKENGNEHFLYGIETAREIVANAPTIGEDMAEALECFRRTYVLHGIVCEQKKCKWRCEGRSVGLDNGYCAWNNLLGDAVRLLGGEPGKEVTLRDKADRC